MKDKKNLYIAETAKRRKPRRGIGRFLGDSKRERKQSLPILLLAVLLTLAVGILSVLFVKWLLEHEESVNRMTVSWKQTTSASETEPDF